MTSRNAIIVLQYILNPNERFFKRAIQSVPKISGNFLGTSKGRLLACANLITHWYVMGPSS